MRKIPFSPPDITEEEIEAVAEVLRSGWITTGPKTKELEREIKEYTKAERAVCLNSATAAMECILRVLGVGPGDEVITSAYTYTASCSVICHVGATPVIVDTARDSFEMDYEKLEAAITEKTKAIIPVDYAGTICDYHAIFEVVERKKHLFHATSDLQKLFARVVVVADSAHAFGASRNGVMCGNIADFTSFSFHAVKNMTTAEGGAVTWKAREGMDSDALYQQFMLLSLHGQNKDALAKTKLGAWEYDIVAPYYKCNMTDIMAAIGLVQYKRYGELLKRRRELLDIYEKELAGMPVEILQHDREEADGQEEMHSSRHLCIVRLIGRDSEFRNELIEAMAKEGVSTNVHYKPLPMLTAYKNMGFAIEDYPNAYAMFANEITLPLHTKLTNEDVYYITKVFRECYDRQVK